MPAHGLPGRLSAEAARVFCPCHQSRYDPERLGSLIQGLAVRPLPKIRLEVRNGAVFAVGVDGWIYGRRSDLAPGKKVGG